MSEKSRIGKPPNDLSFVEEIKAVYLPPEHTRMTILQLVFHYRNNFDLTKVPMVFEVPEGFRPTDEDKLANLWGQKVNPNKNTVQVVARGIYHQNAEPVYKNPNSKRWLTVKQFLPGKCVIKV